MDQLGRRISKGEKGIRILAPMVGIRRKKDSEAEKEITRQNQPVLVGFRTAHVFDVEQTSGAELPESKKRVKGEVGEYRERLIDFIIAQGIEFEFKESIAPALGLSTDPKSPFFPDSPQRKSSARWFMRRATNFYINRIAGPPQPRPFAKPRPRQSPLSSRKPSASTLEKAQPTTSTCTTATPRFWPRAWK